MRRAPRTLAAIAFVTALVLGLQASAKQALAGDSTAGPYILTASALNASAMIWTGNTSEAGGTVMNLHLPAVALTNMRVVTPCSSGGRIVIDTAGGSNTHNTEVLMRARRVIMHVGLPHVTLPRVPSTVLTLLDSSGAISGLLNRIPDHLDLTFSADDHPNWLGIGSNVLYDVEVGFADMVNGLLDKVNGLIDGYNSTVGSDHTVSTWVPFPFPHVVTITIPGLPKITWRAAHIDPAGLALPSFVSLTIEFGGLNESTIDLAGPNLSRLGC